MAGEVADRSEWRHGWPVVAAGVVGIGCGPGLFQNLSSLFTPGMSAEFGWSRGEIATAAGIGLLGALLVPLFGRVADRFGVRPVIAGAMLLLGGAYLGLASMGGSLWQYQLLVLALALSVPGTSALSYGKLIAARFEAHRGLALGLATSGISLTTLALPPAMGAVIAAQGWRGGFVALALLVVAVALPLVLLLIRGAMPRAGHAAAMIHEGMTGGEARRTRRFWTLAGCGLLVTMATVGLVTQLVPWGLDHGLSARQAAALLTGYGASQVVGRLAMGALVDRFRPRLMAAGFCLLSALGFAGLQLDEPGFSLALLLVFLAGLMHGAEFDLLPFLTARLFGLRAYGEVYGTVLMMTLIGTGLGIVGFGRLHDATGGYGWALGLASAALVLTALGFLSLADPVDEHGSVNVSPEGHSTGSSEK